MEEKKPALEKPCFLVSKILKFQQSFFNPNQVRLSMNLLKSTVTNLFSEKSFKIIEDRFRIFKISYIEF